RLSRRGAVVVIATRWHKDDLIGRLLEESKQGGDQWEVISLPALADENDPLGREPGEELWPERQIEVDGELETIGFGQENLNQTRAAYYAGGYPWMWEALYQQKPPEVIDAEFDPAWFGEHVMFDQWPDLASIRFRVVALDPSLG